MNQKKGNYNKPRNAVGLISIIIWALVLTVLFNSCQSSLKNASTVEVDYSTFKEWVQQGKVERVHMVSGKYNISLKDGVEVKLPDRTSDNTLIDILGKEGVPVT